MTALRSTTWTDLANRDTPPVVVIPCGSTEQHGPHLPLDTDTRIAVALTERLHAARPDVLVADPLAFGASWEHAGFPGLLSITEELVVAVLVELARSGDWAAGLLFVNGHGGNTSGIAEAVRVITAEGRRALAWSPRLTGSDLHAGNTETSIMLALDPAAVVGEALTAGAAADLRSVIREGVAAVSPTGVLGDPRAATADHGRELLDQLAADLITAYDRWLT